MEKPTCGTCVYWESAHCKCHKKSPTVAVTNNENGAPSCPWAYFPGVSAEQWCGEHPDIAKWLAEQEDKSADTDTKWLAIQRYFNIKPGLRPSNGQTGQIYLDEKLKSAFVYTRDKWMRISFESFDNKQPRGSKCETCGCLEYEKNPIIYAPVPDYGKTLHWMCANCRNKNQQNEGQAKCLMKNN